jgi:hypothetical protein
MLFKGGRTHKHHIIPKYMGGTDEPENIVEVTVTQHAMFHFCNYQLWGNEEDRIAWRALSGLITLDEAALEAMVLGSKKGGKITGNKSKENKTGIFGLSPEQLSEASKKGGEISGPKSGKITSSQKWQCTETGYVSTAGALTNYQKAKGIDTSNRIRVDGPRRWEITSEDGIVIFITQTLKEWAKENDYSYDCLLDVRRGKTRRHRDIIKVVPL